MSLKHIYQTHKMLVNKEVSSVELTKQVISNFHEAKNNSMISWLEDSALLQARKADEKISSGESISPLHGIPYSLKDLFVTKGIRTTAGSQALFNYIPPFDGHVSAKLKQAGGVLVGKNGCDEFGMGSTNECTPFGTVLNPLNSDYVAGGSSGGSAASVAEGSSYYSIGTDTGGSVRLPANFCGLVGFKPSYGKISRYGQIAYASSLDQASPMAQSSLDIACIVDELFGDDPRDATNISSPDKKLVSELNQTDASFIKGKKLGYCPEFIDACDPEVRTELNQALDDFKSLGVELVEVSLPHLKHCISTYYIIATSEASSNLSRYDGIHYGLRKFNSENLIDSYIQSRTAGFGKEVKKRIMIGTFSLSSGYYDAYFKKACQVRRLIAEDFKSAFNQCDIYLGPVCSSKAMKIGVGVNDSFKMYMNDLYTIPVNLAGLPALALPYNKTGSGLPTGFQLIGKQFDDEFVLKFGHAFEVGGQS